MYRKDNIERFYFIDDDNNKCYTSLNIFLDYKLDKITREELLLNSFQVEKKAS